MNASHAGTAAPLAMSSLPPRPAGAGAGVLAGLLAVDLLLTVSNPLAFMLTGRVPDLIFLDGEGNLPSWWSSMQLLLAGLLLGLVALRSRRLDRAAWMLALLAAALVAMSVDEASGLHERAGLLVDKVLGGRAGTTFHRTGLWVFVLGLPAALLLGWMLCHLSRFLAAVAGARRWLLAGLVLLLGGAVGVEALSNFVFPEGAMEAGRMRGIDLAMVCLEEFLEMAGGSVLLWASLRFVLQHWSTRCLGALLVPLRPGEAAR